MLIFGSNKQLGEHLGILLRAVFISMLVWAVFELLFGGHVWAADPDPQSGAGTATGLRRAWDSIYVGGGGHPSLFGTLATSLKGIGIIALVLQAVRIIAKYAGDDTGSARDFARLQIIERLIPNLIVIMLLANNGAGGAQLVITARDFIFAWDKVASSQIQVIVDDIKQDMVVAEERRVLEDLKGRYESCIAIPPKIAGENNPIFTTCIGEFKTEVYGAIGKIKNESVKARIAKLWDDLSASSQGNDDNSEWRGLVNLGAGLSSVVGSIGQDATEKAINTIMLSIGMAYNILIEMALMLIGVSLPLVLMFSLYKIDVFLRWLPQILNLFVAKISYTIAAAVVMFIRADAGSDLGVWGLSIIMGLGCPLVSFFIAVAVSGSMGSLFERESVRGIAAGARLAASGVGAVSAAGAGAVRGASAGTRSIARRV